MSSSSHELLRVAGAGRYRTLPAQVIAVGPAQGFAWTVTIDAGELDGLEVDMTVINGAGLVGRVVEVGPRTATVVLLVDATTSVWGPGGGVAGDRHPVRAPGGRTCCRCSCWTRWPRWRRGRCW